MINSDSVERICNGVLAARKLPGQFIVMKHYDQGPIPIAKTYVVELFWNYRGTNMVVLHVQEQKAVPYSPYVYDSVYEKLLMEFVIKGSEIWNLINTKLQ